MHELYDAVLHIILCAVCAVAIFFLGGCVGLQQGAPVDAAALAVPKVVEDAKKPTEPTPELKEEVQRPTRPARNGFKAWIPRHVTANGDIHEGHYVDVSDKAPQKELMKPDYDVPKAPKQIYRPPATATGSTTASPLRPQVQQPSLQQHPWLQQPLSPQPALQGGLPLLHSVPQEGAYEPALP